MSFLPVFFTWCGFFAILFFLLSRKSEESNNIKLYKIDILFEISILGAPIFFGFLNLIALLYLMHKAPDPFISNIPDNIFNVLFIFLFISLPFCFQYVLLKTKRKISPLGLFLGFVASVLFSVASLIAYCWLFFDVDIYFIIGLTPPPKFL